MKSAPKTGPGANAQGDVIYSIAVDGQPALISHDRLQARVREISRLLDMPAPELTPGDEASAQVYVDLINRFQRDPAFADLWFDPEIPNDLRDALRQAWQEGVEVRLFLGDPATGEVDMEAGDQGFLTCIEAPLRMPALQPSIKTARGAVKPDWEMLPEIVDASRIVRLQDVQRRQDLWRHPAYRECRLRVRREGDNYVVFQKTEGGDAVAGVFSSHAAADRFLAFAIGNRRSHRLS